MTPIKQPIRASMVAAFLGKPLCGDDLVIDRAASWAAAGAGALVFMQHHHAETADRFNRIRSLLVLADPSSEGKLTCSHIVVQDPRLAYAYVAQKFFEPPVVPLISSSAIIHPAALIGRNVSVGHGAVIEDDVTIGDETFVGHGVIIRARTRIGRRCIIRANVVIGEPGFGFDFDQKTPVRIPHFGGVSIGDDVQVGCSCTISCGTLDDTTIGNFVKIDDQVIVAHNAVIGEKTVITAGAVICGNVRLGRSVWVGAGSVIRQGGVEVGDDAMVGLGAVVVAPVLPRQVVMGNPARVLRMRKENEEF